MNAQTVPQAPEWVNLDALVPPGLRGDLSAWVDRVTLAGTVSDADEIEAMSLALSFHAEVQRLSSSVPDGWLWNLCEWVGWARFDAACERFGSAIPM